MPTYAVLGATGQAGIEVTKLLLQRSDITLHLYARSEARLYEKHSSLSGSSNAKIFIGALDDATVLDACLDHADVIISTVAQNQNEPGCSIAQRTARALMDSLSRQRDRSANKDGYRSAILVWLSSAAVDDRVDKSQQAWASWVVGQAKYHIYADLARSIALLKEHDWLRLIIAAPGGLVHGPANGVTLTAEPYGQQALLTYADLGEGIVKMADDEQWVGKQVGLIVEGPVSGGQALLRYLLPNLLASVSPPLWRLGRGYWPR